MRPPLAATFVLFLASSQVGMAQSPAADPEVKTLVEGNNEFGLALYQQLSAQDGNLFLSPYSISNAFALTYAGARENTAAEMRETLRFRLADDQLHPAFGRLIAHLHGTGEERPFQLTVANRLWGQQDYGFLPEFIQLGDRHYGAGLEEVDFVRAAEAARLRINAWVAERTGDKIQDLIPPGVLDDMSRLVLTNAIYFKAPWAIPFQEDQTEPGDFQLASGEKVTVPMMRQSLRARFAEFDDFRMVQLPYEGLQQSMLVLLPTQHDRLPDLEKRLTAEHLTQWMTRLSAHEVDLHVPRFKITAEFQLNDALQAMGLHDAFVFRQANFRGMATREELYITAALHKAFVEVNEAGTEAAASTAIVIGTRALPPPATFQADHPFVFLIRDDRSGSILFVGRLADPS
jgi:serpin B